MNKDILKIMDFSPENKKVFDELAGLCVKRLIVPYIGAGMSVFAGFKTWNNFINTEYENCFQKKKPNEIDNIIAADLIEQKQGKVFFYENVRTSFGGDLNDTKWRDILEKAGNQAISVIPKLCFGPIVTTNFDQIIEKIHQNELPVVFPHNLDELEKAVDNRKRLVYKIHGCVSDAHKVVFTKSVYDNVYNPNSELVKSLSSFFKGFHFLFLGSSLDVSKSPTKTKDYSMDLWEQLQNTGTYHFAILDCTKDQLVTRRKELEDRNIHPILFESGKFESVKIILDKLLKDVDLYSLNIPQYKSSYTERKDSIIEQINSRLYDQNYSALALTGMGGVGKTRILSEYTIRKKEESKYTDIVWFNAISDTNIREEIHRFLVKKGKIKEDEKDLTQISLAFKRWMQDNENWLFLLDNVEHYEDIKLFFDSDQTLVGKRHILMSSRLDAEKLPNIPILPIEVFTMEVALKFLQCYTNKETDEYADKIAHSLGYLPLALEQAAAFIKEQNESYQGYFEELEKAPFDLLEKMHPEPGAVSVAATWNMAMQRIKSEAAKELLWLCAYFAPENIHNQWFVGASEILPKHLKNDIQTQLSEIEEQLKKYSLVKIDNNRISLHRLLQGVIQKTLENEQRKWVNHCVQIVDKLRFTDFSTPESRNLFFILAPHIDAITNGISDEEATKEVSRLHNFSGWGFYVLADFPQSLKRYEKTLAISEKILGKEHQDRVTAYNNMAMVYHAQGNYNLALEYYGKALEISEKVLGKEHPRTAAHYNNIALVYSSLGNHDLALEYYGKALEIAENVLGKEHPHTAKTYDNIAGVYLTQGNYDLALEYHRKALEIEEKVFGKEHPETALTYNNIAMVYYLQGNYDLALKYFKIALENREKDLGKEHPDTANTYNGIAEVYYEQGNYDFALEYFRKALVISEKVFSNKHRFTAILYNNIAEVYRVQGKYDLSLEFCLKALEIHNYLAETYNSQGNFDLALEYYGMALEVVENLLGKEHRYTAVTYNNIAEVYHAQGDYDNALKYYENTLAISEKVFGTEHPNTATTNNNIATVYRAQGNYDCALEYFGKTLAIREKVLGKEHTDTDSIYNNIAGVYFNKGDYEHALEYFRKTLVISEKVLGKEHTDTATTYNNIALVYNAQGNYDLALKYYGKTLAIFEKVFGTEHSNTANTYNNIAAVYEAQNNYNHALEWYLMSLSILVNVLGIEHPNTKTVFNNYEICQRKKRQARTFRGIIKKLVGKFRQIR